MQVDTVTESPILFYRALEDVDTLDQYLSEIVVSSEWSS